MIEDKKKAKQKLEKAIQEIEEKDEEIVKVLESPEGKFNVICEPAAKKK